MRRVAHGVLLDSSGEFFVAEVTGAAGGAADAPQHEGSAAAPSLEEAHAAEWHHGFQVTRSSLPGLRACINPCMSRTRPTASSIAHCMQMYLCPLACLLKTLDKMLMHRVARAMRE
jgi:hypothetical protein